VDAFELLKSYDRNGVLGELTGASVQKVERFFRLAHRQAVSALEEARARAKAEKQEIPVDASRLAGVNGGDVWIVAPDGKTRRELEMFPGVEAQLLDPGRRFTELRPCSTLTRARPLFARCAYNGLWSPSGTNWQPIRSLELLDSEVARLTGAPSGSCGLLVLARRRYQSILSDIAGLCGFEQASHAEHIDLGIWLLCAEQTACSHGWELAPTRVADKEQEQATRELISVLGERVKNLSGPEAAGAQELLRSVQMGDHYPAYILLPSEGRPLVVDERFPGGLRPSHFDRLVQARSTQRVASPAGELEAETLGWLFKKAQEFVPDQIRSALACPVFTRHDEFPAEVGKAMHEGIEGSSGLMHKASLSRLKSHLCFCRELPDEVEKWTKLDEEHLEFRGKNVALPARLVPVHICAKLQEGGHFRQKGEYLMDHRDRPLSPVRLMKLVRMMARSFGRFFLTFQNTHPLLGVVLAPPDDAAYRAVGRLVAHMTFLSRARGQVSIIKSGPLEIAGKAIREHLKKHVRSAGKAEPVVTFQVGLPLGPDEIVSKGQPDEHDGAKERLLDRRAPRAPLASHYIPVV
jgi:hypothetical protein